MVHMIPKLKVGTLQLQDNCMQHIKQLIKPDAPITRTSGTCIGFYNRRCSLDIFIRLSIKCIETKISIIYSCKIFPATQTQADLSAPYPETPAK